MKVKINDEWGIKSNEYQYILCKMGKRKKREDGKIVKDDDGNPIYKEVFEGFRYTYETLADVLEAYRRYRTRTEKNITSFEQILELQKEIKSEIEDIKEKLEVD